MKSIKPFHSFHSKNSVTLDESSPTIVKEGSETKHEVTTSRVLLDPELALNEFTGGENPNPKLLEFDLLNANESTEGNPRSSESKTFTCNFCGREFSTSQALGGHQNAHKQERALAKHRHNNVEMAAAANPYGHRNAYSYYPYYSTYSHQPPLYGGFNRPVGVRAQSGMIEKPYSYHRPPPPPPLPMSPYIYYSSRENPVSTPENRLGMGNFRLRGLGASNPNPSFVDSARNAFTINTTHNQRLRLIDGDDGNDRYDASGIDLDLKL